MKFTAPRGFWQWLACFSPVIINWLALFQGPRIEFALFGYPHGENPHLAWAVWGIYSLALGAVSCLGLGGWIARSSNSWQDIAAGALVYGIGLIVVNAAIAFGGCAIAGSTGHWP